MLPPAKMRSILYVVYAIYYTIRNRQSQRAKTVREVRKTAGRSNGDRTMTGVSDQYGSNGGRLMVGIRDQEGSNENRTMLSWQPIGKQEEIEGFLSRQFGS